MKIKLLPLLVVILFCISGQLLSQNRISLKNSLSQSSPTSVDTDGDGIPDHIDWDDDNDGILDISECPGNNIIKNGTFTGNANGWTVMPFGWMATNNRIEFVENYKTNSDLSQNISNLNQTNNTISLTLTLGAQDGNYAAGSTATLQILLNNTVYATIKNGTSRSPTVNNVTITLSNGATSDFVPFTTANVTTFTIRTFTINIPNASIPSSSTLVFRATTGIDDWLLDDISIKAFTCDTDGDGIFNHLDLDSDNDGCFDALEGDENVIPLQLNANGALSGAVDSQGVPVLVNAGGAADIGSDQGQGIGSSQNPNVSTCPCEQPVITISSNTICYGGSVTLTSSQATGNTWSTGETTQAITVNNPGTYTVSYTNGICVPTSTSTIITAESDANIQITGNLILCETPTQLTASANGTGNTYTWSNGSTGTTISVSTPGTYTVTVKTQAGCQYQKSVTVTQGIVPVVQNTSLSQCSHTSTATFDLTSAQTAITSTPGVSFDYYLSQTDAVAGNNNTIATPTAYVSGNAIIYVRVKSVSCFKIAQLQLIISTTATPSITASSHTICYGGNITLTSSQATGNTWSTGETTQTITVNNPGTYTLTSTLAGCQSVPASITITEESDANIQITGNLILCESPTQLTASANGTGNTYTWSNGSTGTTISVSTPGTYTVTVKTQAGCQYQKSVTVTQGIVPVVQNSSLSQCSHTSTATFDLTSAQTAITSTPGVSFDYYLSQTDAVAGNNNTIATPTAYVSGNAIIYVRVKSASCFKIAQLQLIMSTTATPSITASSNTICYGGNITLTSSQATGNTWSTGETTQVITVNNPGTYTLTSTLAGCQSVPASITITVENDPNIQITGNLILCESPTQLTASANGTGNTYTWSNGSTGTTISVSTPGTYTVTVKTQAGCQYQKSVTVTQGIVPVVQNTSLSQCSHTSTATFDLTSAQTAITSTPGVSFDYYLSQADAVAGNNNTIATPLAYVSGNAIIYVRVKSASCFKIAQLQLIISTTATPSITASSHTICYGGNITLTSSQATGNTWSTGETTQVITVNNPGTYTLTSTLAGCQSVPASITITLENDPNIQITGNLILCESPTQLTASANGTGNTYTWSNGSTGTTIPVSTPGTYTVTVKTQAGCQYQKSVTVTQGIIPVVQNTSLSQCSHTSTATFDLTSAQTAITSTPGVSFDYYLSQTDAVAGNNNTIATPMAYVSGNAIIYVRVKSASCFKIAQLQLIISTTATPSITASSNTICYGGNITLTSSQATGNTWSTGETTQVITVNNPGTYTLTSTLAGCQSVPTSITITEESDANIQITGNLILCESPTQLTASANGTGNTYTWSNGSTGDVISVTTPGIYTVTVKTQAGCQYQKSVTVTQGIVPVVQNSSLSQCSHASTATFDLTSAQTAITSTPGVSFDYYLSQTDAVAGNNNTIATPAAYVSGNTIIYVRVKSASCFKIAEIQLEINTPPLPVITASATAICHTSSVILTSASPTGNIWSTGETTSSISVNVEGTYSLTVNNGTCISNPVSIFVIKAIDPNLQITGNTMFCQGSSTTLTATASGTGNTFSWSNGVNTASNTVTNAGTYTVTVTTSVGCQYQKSITVKTDPIITINIATPTQITCIQPQISLDATASVYQPGATFLWTATNGGHIISGANTLTPLVNNSGTYTLTISSATAQGCVKQASVNVIKNTTPPMLSLSAPSLTICKGESVTITATGAVNYTWTGLSGTGNSHTVTPADTTTYSITGTGTNGCTATASITIKVVPEITSLLHSVEICEGDQVTLDAGTGPNYMYKWSNGATTQIISPTQPGTYTVIISNGYCSKDFSATVNLIPKPEILEIIYKDKTLTVKAKNNGSLPLEYSIDGGITWQTSSVFTNVFKNTLYPIYVRNQRANCYASSDYFTFFMSNVITPNYDGHNDILDFSIISKYGNFNGSISDRYGKVVFKISSKNPIWDGIHLGRPLPTDTYWYRLFWEDRITKKPVEISGWVLLKNRN